MISKSKITPAVTFTYDQNNQLGYCTSMGDGSGSTAWTYDARGRVTQETKIILGQSFTTGWSYNSADLPVNMTYPDSEVVISTYLPQMALNTLTGTDNYITASQYDSAGRRELLTVRSPLFNLSPILCGLQIGLLF
jgi:YD repeat-containing protein